MKGNMKEETIAKTTTRRELAEMTDGSSTTDTTNTETQTMPEMPADTATGEMPENMNGGPMGGGFPGEMTAMTAIETNEWLVPMTATGIISGTVILAAAAICLTIFFTNRRKTK